MPLKIGLTGGIGSGKSSAAALFAELGAEVIDADDISHQLTRQGSAALDAIRAAFGGAVFQPDGNLDRAAMRRLVFSDPAAKAGLEAILHPLIRQELLGRIALSRAPYLVMVAPLLLEAPGYRELAERVLVVDCTEAAQVARTQARSGLTETEVRAIMAGQLPRAARLQHADDILDNSGDAQHLRRQVMALHEKYLALAQAAAR